jgi:membrane-bound lytic murein transglycosylase D
MRGRLFRAVVGPILCAALVCGGFGLAAAPAAAASSKHAKKTAAAKKSGKKSSGKGSAKQRPKAPRAKGSAPGTPDPHARATVTGGLGAATGPAAEVEELKALDPVLFPELTPKAAPPWHKAEGPRVSASGLPAPPPPAVGAPGAIAIAPTDVAWLDGLAKPDIPFRWDPRVVRYLEFYRSSPKGRSMATAFLKKFGRYGEAIRRVLRRHGMPEDIAWLAMMESAFNPRAQSPAGAAGLWQFTPRGAQAYGLRIDRWVDERLDPERSTDAAARYLIDLHRRFGRWELAFAAYNMGYGALLSSIRKYNTNDFWELCRLEAGLPLETALYVPKIIAIAVVARNPAAFGLEGIEPDEPETFEVATVGPSVSLAAIAISTGADIHALRRLNPQLLDATTPPPSSGPSMFAVRVPVGAAEKLEGKNLERPTGTDHDRIAVRWGESLEAIAADRGTTEQKIRQLNGISSTVPLRPGTTLFVPKKDGPPPAAASDEPETIVVSRPPVALPGRKHVLYEVVWGDKLADVARVLGVTVDELCRWNAIDATAQLHGRMILQAFVDPRRKTDEVRLRDPGDVRLLVAGTDAFFEHVEGEKGRQRLKVTVGEGDTFKEIAKKYGLSLGMLERINHRSRWDALRPGETLVVYAKAPAKPVAKTAADEDDVTGPSARND